MRLKDLQAAPAHKASHELSSSKAVLDVSPAVNARRRVFRLSAKEQWPLWLLAAAVLALIVVRIGVQSITMDEGGMYVNWVNGGSGKPWDAHSNNHLLVTYLIWLFSHLFGLNNYSMRLPSLMGAFLYMSAAYRFCTLFVEGLSLRLPLYACFVVNPFVLDFFVAARGYGLALGFFTTAVVTMCELLLKNSASRRYLLTRIALASSCLALSVVSNFSFAFACVTALGLFLVMWTGQELSRPEKERAVEGGGSGFYLQLWFMAIAPGILLTLALAGWALFHWPNGQIVAGASSLSEAWTSFLEMTFSDLSPRILGPFLFKTFRHWRKALPWILIGLTFLQICYIFVRWNHWRYRPDAKRRIFVSLYLGGVLALVLALHLFAFRYAGLLLPKDRTAIFFVPLCLMIVGAVAGFPYSDRFGKLVRWASVAILVVGSAYFVGCLRLHYFLLWRYDAETEPVYRKLVEIVGRGHNVRVPAGYLYGSALDYYREYFNDNSFTQFALWDSPEHAPATHFPPYPLDSSVYVLTFPQDEAFATKQHLRIVYRAPMSDVVVAVR